VRDTCQAWLLTADERGNPATAIDLERGKGRAWTVGNRVTVHVDGAAYFTRLHELLSGLGAGDWVYLADWRIDATRQPTGAGSELGPLVADQRGRRLGSPTRSCWSSTARTTPSAASPSSAASTWPAAAATTLGISETPTRSGSTPATGGGRPGTTCSWSWLARARSLVYLEDQYLWGTLVADALAAALRRAPELRMIIVVPRHPDRDRRLSGRAAQWRAIDQLAGAGGRGWPSMTWRTSRARRSMSTPRRW
jgi:hypothetical protein